MKMVGDDDDDDDDKSGFKKCERKREKGRD